MSNLAARILAQRLRSRIEARSFPVPLKDFGLDPKFPHQNKFILDNSQFIDAQCSRRAGKSSGLAIRFFNTMAKYPGSTCRYLALTGDSARDIMWPVLEELDDKYKIGLKFLPSKLTVTAPSGGKLRLYGADMKNFIRRLRGNKAPGIAVDEAQDFGSHLEYLVDDILTPMMADFADSWLAITGTPGPVPSGYFYKVTKEKKYGYSHHEWTILDNPHIPDPAGFINRLIEQRQWEPNHPTLLREWRNNWVVDLEALWVRYKEAKCDFDELPKIALQWNHILGIDIGYKDADALVVLAWSSQGPETYLVEERITPKQDITGLRLQIEELQKKYNPHKMVMDAGALGLKIQEELRNRYGLPLEAADKKRKQENIEIMNDAMRLGYLRIKKDSRFVSDSYVIQVDWEKSTPDRIKLKGPHSDAIDAVLYAFKESPAFHYAPPEVKPLPGTPEYVRMEEEKHLEATIERLKREKNANQGDNAFNSWGKDKKGIPDWNKW